MTDSHLLYWPIFFLLVIILYLGPGLAAQTLITPSGLSWYQRVLLAVPVSLFLTPIILVAVSNFHPIIPTYGSVLLITVLLFLLGMGWRRIRPGPVFSLRARVAEYHKPSLREWILVSLAILSFALLVSLPRIDMFIHGDQATASAGWDEYWHVAEVTSVARTGIPPQHYFFPDAPMVYYYFSWINPATLVNQPFLEISIARALAVQSFIQVMSFIGLIYVFIRMNFKKVSTRIWGLASFTIIGGLDYFTLVEQLEWWQKYVGWLVSNNQVSSFVTLYLWVPQHVAGGMAFVLGLLLWRNIRSSLAFRVASLGLLFAFTFGTSVFVFIGGTLASIVWVWVYRLRIFRWKNIRWVLLLVFLFLLIDWHQLQLTLSHNGSIGISNFRVPLLERIFNMSSEKVEWADYFLTLGLFPLFGSIILFYEFGAVFIIYILWWVQNLFLRKTPWKSFLFIFPLMYFILSWMITDKGGGDNFSMRGMIPAQISLVLGSLCLIDGWQLRKGLRYRLFFGYLVGVVLITQSISWGIDLQRLIINPLGSAFRIRDERIILGLTVASDIQWPEPLEYIHWINANTPGNALIVEEGSLSEDNPKYRLLERIRFLNPDDTRTMQYIFHDRDLMPKGALEDVAAKTAGNNILSQALDSEYRKTHPGEVYLVSRHQQHPEYGPPVYKDLFVEIYRIE